VLGLISDEGLTPDACSEVAARYAYLASWSAACGWRRARSEFVVRLCWSQLYRRRGAMVVWDAG